MEQLSAEERAKRMAQVFDVKLSLEDVVFFYETIITQSLYLSNKGNKEGSRKLLEKLAPLNEIMENNYFLFNERLTVGGV